MVLLPLAFKTLIEKDIIDEDITKFNNTLYNKYSEYKENFNLLIQLKSMKAIPFELLAKYYCRFYTSENGQFYKDINTALNANKINEYLPFIKVLYEGVKSKALTLSDDKILYRGTNLQIDEIEKIKKYLKEKNIQIVFSKYFFLIQ